MAKAFELFAKRFSRAYGVAAWRVTGSYDQSVEGKDAAGRRYRGSVGKLRASMIESFAASAAFEDIDDLVRSRTEEGSPVADAIAREALRADEQLAMLDREAASCDFEAAGPWDVIGLRFALDDAFRAEFGQALRADGFEGDARGLWQGVDRIAKSLGDGAAAGCGPSDYGELVRCQREMTQALVLATLEGPRDYAQLAGHDADETPSIPVARLRAMASASKRRMRLQRVFPTGPNPWDYATSPRDSWELTQAGARIGRDELWCGEGPFAPLPIVARGVSRQHCEIRRQGTRWLLRDLMSFNGTLLVRPDGRRTLLSDSEEEIRPGDILCLAPRKVSAGYEASCFSWGLGTDEVCLRLEACVE